MPRTTEMSKLKKTTAKNSKAKVPTAVVFPSAPVPSSVLSSAFGEALASHSENNLKRPLDDDELTDDDIPVATTKRVAELEKEVELLQAKNASLVTANESHIEEFARIKKGNKERAKVNQGISNKVTHIRDELDEVTARLAVVVKAEPTATEMRVTALEKRVAALETAPVSIAAAGPCELKDEVARLRVLVDALCKLSSSQYKANIDSIKSFKEVVQPGSLSPKL